MMIILENSHPWDSFLFLYFFTPLSNPVDSFFFLFPPLLPYSWDSYRRNNSCDYENGCILWFTTNQNLNASPGAVALRTASLNT